MDLTSLSLKKLKLKLLQEHPFLCLFRSCALVFMSVSEVFPDSDSIIPKACCFFASNSMTSHGVHRCVLSQVIYIGTNSGNIPSIDLIDQ